MRPSPLKHPLAILRLTIGLTQKQMGDMVNRAARTIQSIELKHLPLTEELALRIAEATGVDECWLLEGNPDVPPQKGLTCFRSGKGQGVYTKADYEFHRAFLEAPIATPADIEAIKKVAQEKGGENVDVPMGVLKNIVVRKQAALSKETDRTLMLMLAVILNETAITQVTFLARWKIRRFFEELAKDMGVKLASPTTPIKDSPLPKPSRKKRKA